VWLDFVNWKLKDLNVLKMKRLAEEQCGDQESRSEEMTLMSDKVSSDERKWNKYVEKELDGVVKRVGAGKETETEVQNKDNEVKDSSEGGVGETHSETTPTRVEQTSGELEQTMCPKASKVNGEGEKRASGESN
jgi:hypothetical protein